VTGIMAGIQGGGDPSILGVAGDVDIVECQFISATNSGPISAAASCIQQLASLGATIQNHRWGLRVFHGSACHLVTLCWQQNTFALCMYNT
jgi:hypothetical protein